MSDERGSAALEITLITPLLVLILLFVVGLGRLAQARGELDGAARDAARAASIARSPSSAQADAQSAAAATLADRSITCANLNVAVDASEFRPGGSVIVDLTCTVKLSDLVGVGFGSDRDLHGHAISVIDTYRGVSG